MSTKRAVSYTHLDVYKRQELVVMVGMPGSGKSTMAKEKFVRNGFVRVCNDELGNWNEAVADLSSVLNSQPNNCLLYTSRCV